MLTPFGITIEEEIQDTVHWGGLAKPSGGTYIPESGSIFGLHAFSYPFTYQNHIAPLFPTPLPFVPPLARGSHAFILDAGPYRRLHLSFLLIVFCFLESIPSGRSLLIALAVSLFDVHADALYGDITRRPPLLRELYPCRPTPLILRVSTCRLSSVGVPSQSTVYDWTDGRLLPPDG
jgi:hypothetical protein